MIVVEVKQQVEGERTDGEKQGALFYALGTAVRSATLRSRSVGFHRLARILSWSGGNC